MKISIDSPSPCFLSAVIHTSPCVIVSNPGMVCFASSEFLTTPPLCVESGVAPFLSVALPARPGGRTKGSCPTGQEAEPRTMDGQSRESSRKGRIRETKVYVPDTELMALSTWYRSIFMINL